MAEQEEEMLYDEENEIPIDDGMKVRAGARLQRGVMQCMHYYCASGERSLMTVISRSGVGGDEKAAC